MNFRNYLMTKQAEEGGDGANPETPEWVDDLVKVKEDLVQGIGMPGAIMGAYALGRRPSNGGLNFGGIAGALGGAYAGKALYDWASKSKTMQPHIQEFTNWVNKHTDGKGGQYIPTAAQALGALGGYALFKQSSYPYMQKQANWLKLLAGLGTAGAGILGYKAYQTLDNAQDTIQSYNDAVSGAQNIVDSTNKYLDTEVKPKVTDTLNIANDAAKNAQDAAKNAQKVSSGLADIKPILAAGTGALAIGIPLAVYLSNRPKKKKKKKNREYYEEGVY